MHIHSGVSFGSNLCSNRWTAILYLICAPLLLGIFVVFGDFMCSYFSLTLNCVSNIHRNKQPNQNFTYIAVLNRYWMRPGFYTKFIMMLKDFAGFAQVQYRFKFAEANRVRDGWFRRNNNPDNHLEQNEKILIHSPNAPLMRRCVLISKGSAKATNTHSGPGTWASILFGFINSMAERENAAGIHAGAIAGASIRNLISLWFRVRRSMCN